MGIGTPSSRLFYMVQFWLFVFESGVFQALFEFGEAGFFGRARRVFKDFHCLVRTGRLGLYFG